MVSFYSLALKHIRSQSALKESESKFRDLFETSPIGVFRSTASGEFLDVNPTLARLLGYKSPKELIDASKITPIPKLIYKDPLARERFIREHNVDCSYRA
jgi:PAS domain S-box-containing protein